MGMNALIRYVCTEPGHAAVAGALGDLTVHDGSWAFCPGERHSGHQWQDVGGVGVDALARFGLRQPAGGISAA